MGADRDFGPIRCFCGFLDRFLKGKCVEREGKG